jgi:hypothetical protein
LKYEGMSMPLMTLESKLAYFVESSGVFPVLNTFPI